MNRKDQEEAQSNKDTNNSFTEQFGVLVSRWNPRALFAQLFMEYWCCVVYDSPYTEPL